jgi:hypothetical protein
MGYISTRLTRTLELAVGQREAVNSRLKKKTEADGRRHQKVVVDPAHFEEGEDTAATVAKSSRAAPG